MVRCWIHFLCVSMKTQNPDINKAYLDKHAPHIVSASNIPYIVLPFPPFHIRNEHLFDNLLSHPLGSPLCSERSNTYRI